MPEHISEGSATDRIAQIIESQSAIKKGQHRVVTFVAARSMTKYSRSATKAECARAH